MCLWVCLRVIILLMLIDMERSILMVDGIIPWAEDLGPA